MDFFNKCNQIPSFLRILSHLLKKSLMENFIFCQRIFLKKKTKSATQKYSVQKLFKDIHKIRRKRLLIYSLLTKIADLPATLLKNFPDTSLSCDSDKTF